MKSISQDDRQMEQISSQIYTFFQRYHVNRLLRSANFSKSKGFSSTLIFLTAVLMAFQHLSFFMELKLFRFNIPFGKDTFYRFMNSCHTNWRTFTLLLSGSIIRSTIEPLTDSSRRNVLIVDDSLFSRNRSKKVELLARVFDHAHHVYTYGFRLLTLGWSDGNTFLPVSSCLLSSAHKKNRMNEASGKVDFRTNGGKQRRLAMMKAPEVMLRLLKEAKAAAIPATHVLFDTWFCSPSSLVAVKTIGYEVVAMAKKSSKVHYWWKEKNLNAKAIYSQCRKRRGRSKYLLSVTAAVQSGDTMLPVRLVFVRNRNKKKDYLILVTTDMSLTEEEVIQLYGKRWGIEVFFKACKSYLRLSKECRSLSYDAMTAHVAVVFTRYMFLAVAKRENEDERSLGELFSLVSEELPDLPFNEAIHLIMMEFCDFLNRNGFLTDAETDQILDTFLKKLPGKWSAILRQCA